MAKNKIRRPIKIGGVTRWICGATEQEYAENLYKAMCAAAPAQAEAVQAEVPQGGRLFSAYAQTWFDVFAKPNIATATAVTYKRQLDAHINPVIGHKDVGEITAADVQAVFNAMGGVTKQTKDKVRTVLNQILNRAVDEGLLGRNPLSMRCIRITGEASRPTQVYPLDMMRQLAANLPRIRQERDRIFAALMAFHPLRQEEALGLKWADIDLEQGVIRVRRAVTHPKRNRPEIKETKTAGSKRELALVKEVAHLLPGGNGDDFVLGGAKPLSYNPGAQHSKAHWQGHRRQRKPERHPLPHHGSHRPVRSNQGHQTDADCGGAYDGGHDDKILRERPRHQRGYGPGHIQRLWAGPLTG